MERVESLFYHLESLKTNPEGFIYDYFERVKNEVDIRREILKQDIDNYSDQIIDQVELAKSLCIKISTQIQVISDELEISATELGSLKKRFNSAMADQDKLSKVQSEISELESHLSERLRQTKHSLLQNKAYSLEFDEIDMGNIFGKLSQKNIGGKNKEIL